MKTTRKYLLGLAALVVLLTPLASSPVAAKQLVLCSPESPVGSTGPRRVTNPGTSGGTYSLNGQGCAVISTANSDAAYFLSQGFTAGPNLFSLVQVGITASTTTTTSQMTLPAGAVIVGIVLNETANHSITGGVDIGTSNAGTDIASAVTLGAQGLVPVLDSALTRLFATAGASVAKQIMVTCHTNCNSGSIDITVLYSYF